MAKVSSIRFTDILPLAWSALRRNRLRSVLTIGAIAFGVAVMVYLVSLGLGLQELTIDSVKKSATLLSFTVTAVNKDIKPLNHDAIAQIKAIPNVQLVLPRLTVSGEVAFGNQRAAVTIVGVDPSYFAYNDQTSLKVGRSFNDGETTSMLVTTSFLKLFGLDTSKAPLITFDINLSSDYGTLPPIQNTVVRGVVEDDVAVAVYVPRDYLESLLGDKQPDYENVRVIVPDLKDIEPTTAAVIALGYKVSTVVDTVDEINRVFRYIQVTMAVLGLIAIIVASIGMFNTLTVSLLERTREIGIMKALGIRRRDVRRLFLTEAALMGILGGLSGIGLALLFQQTTDFIFQILALIAAGNVPQLFDNVWYLPVGSMVFSICIALLTGLYPAGRAAKLNPIQAIRHE